jgi:hypothetical protein
MRRACDVRDAGLGRDVGSENPRSRADLLGHRLQAVRSPPDEQNRPSFVPERLGHRPTDATSRSGHQRQPRLARGVCPVRFAWIAVHLVVLTTILPPPGRFYRRDGRDRIHGKWNETLTRSW